MQTLKERYATWLLAIGYVKVETKSRKYDCYKGNNRYVFLGNKGSFRIGAKPYRTESVSLVSAMRQLLEWENKQNNKG